MIREKCNDLCGLSPALYSRQIDRGTYNRLERDGLAIGDSLMTAVGQGSRRKQGDEGCRPKERHDVERNGVVSWRKVRLEVEGEKRKTWEGLPQSGGADYVEVHNIQYTCL
jgi:hypothetical protein